MKVTFKKGLPGLEEYKDYEIKEIEGGEEFKLLQCNEKERTWVSDYISISSRKRI